MAEIDLRAAKRAYAADELAELLPDVPGRHADKVSRGRARFHLLAFDAGLDLGDPDDAATVAAVLHAVLHTHSEPHIAVLCAAFDAAGAYRKGIE